MKSSRLANIRNISLLLAFTAGGASLVGCGSAAEGGTEGSDEAVSVAQPLTLHPLGVVRDSPSMMASRQVGVSAPGTLPPSVDLTSRLPTPGDQGGEESCVGWATGYATTSFHQEVQEAWALTPSLHRFSPSWVYNQINSGVDRGSNISTAMDLIVNKGADDVASFPYVDGSFTTQPDAASLARAGRFKAKSWATLAVTQAGFKAVLAGNNPIVVAIEVLPDFDAMNSTTNTVYDTVGPTDVSRGSHAIAIIGYDDTRQAFRIINSWGTGWGDGGYGWIAYSFINNAKLGMSAYVLTDASNTLVHNRIDVNSDKLSDLVFHNGTTGATQAWYMNGATRSGFANVDASLNTADASGWLPVAMADFNKDGKADIFWHNGTSGQSQVWFMNGTSRTGAANLSTSLNFLDSSGWRIVGSADFNQDGKPDLFARNVNSGAMQIWYMDGVTRTSFADLSAALDTPDSTGWHFVGVGDFNQDGKTDIVWHNGLTGESQVWYMDGATRTSYSSLDASLNVKDSSGWSFIGATDLNNDGKPDLFAHNPTTGEFQVWFMDNLTRVSFANLDAGLNTPASTGWRALTQ